MRLRSTLLVLGILLVTSPAPAQPPIAAKRVPPLLDAHGDPLPAGAKTRFGGYRLWHESGIASLAFSPDGKIIATGGGYTFRVTGPWSMASSSAGTIRLWDTATGKELPRLDAIPDGIVGALCFSPDGKQLAAGSGSELSMWDLATCKRVHKLGNHQGSIGSVTFPADGQLLHSVSGIRPLNFPWTEQPKPQVCRWDTAFGKLLKNWSPDAFGQIALNADRLCSLTISPDGKWLFRGFSRSGESLRIEDAQTGKPLYQHEGLRADTTYVVFSANGKRFALAGKNHIYVGNTSDKKPLLVIPTPSPPITLSFSPDGKRLASSAEGKPVCLWDADTGKKLRELGPLATRWFSHCTTFSADGQTLAVADNERVRFWDVATGNERVIGPAQLAAIYRLRFSPDGTTLAATGESLCWRWQVTGKTIGQLARLDLEQHGKLLAVTGDHRLGVIKSKAGTYSLYDTERCQPIRNLTAGNEEFTRAHFAADDRTLILLQEGEIRKDMPYVIFDVATGTKLVGGIHPNTLCVPVVSSDRKLIACLDSDGKIALANLDGKIVRTLGGTSLLELRKYDASCFFVFSPDSRYLLSVLCGAGAIAGTADDGADIVLWETASGKWIRKLNFLPKGSVARVACAAFSPDGRTLALGQYRDRHIHLLELSTGQVRRKLDGHKLSVLSLAFAPDGRSFASGSEDGTVLIWDYPAAAPRNQPGTVESLWADLASNDASRAFDAIAEMSAVPTQTVPFLKARLKPVMPVSPDTLKALVQDLDSNTFAVRDRAARELEKYGELAVPHMTAALRNSSVELRRRVEQLLSQADTRRHDPSPETLRLLRSLEVLERIGTPEAVELLRVIASGPDAARLTQDARATLERIEKRARE